eukprot:TRINITY_DN9930_c0_g1_i5.p1 TRINITY_DN9930_c0_g1~~TRINITY_DN9930_c0_g1_i5.p1  ORF type:complete len:127 (-),score=15.90 TRINITY_DN9930_c0_g1_i5:34-414(-)
MEASQNGNVIDKAPSASLNIPEGSDLNTYKKKKESNLIQAGFNTYKIFVGLGILVFPYLFQKTGWILALLSLVFIGVFTYYAMYLVLQIADRVDKSELTLYELGGIAYGPHTVSYTHLTLPTIYSV